MQIALFITCFNDTLFPETGIAMTHLLERLGIQVTFPLVSNQVAANDLKALRKTARKTP